MPRATASAPARRTRSTVVGSASASRSRPKEQKATSLAAKGRQCAGRAVQKRPAAATSAATRRPKHAAPAPRGESFLPQAVVLNLARRQDRWTDIQAQLEQIHAFKYERVDAVDGVAGDVIPEDVVTLQWSTAQNWKYVTRAFEGGEDCGYRVCKLPLTGGERGCAASHVAMWRRCADLPEEPLLILEDDALPLKGFAQRLRRALADLQEGSEAPDLLYLGYTQAAPWRRKVSAVVREAEYLWTTVGYVIWPSGARKLLAALPVNQPVDNFMADLVRRGALRGFAVKPPVLKQAKEWNVDSDVAHSDDVAWKQNCPRLPEQVK